MNLHGAGKSWCELNIVSHIQMSCGVNELKQQSSTYQPNFPSYEWNVTGKCFQLIWADTSCKKHFVCKVEREPLVWNILRNYFHIFTTFLWTRQQLLELQRYRFIRLLDHHQASISLYNRRIRSFFNKESTERKGERYGYLHTYYI